MARMIRCGDGGVSDTSSSSPVSGEGESKVLSPDGETPPVPVASSSPLPTPAQAQVSPLPAMEDEETREIVSQDGQLSPAGSGGGGGGGHMLISPSAPTKGQKRPQGYSPNKEKGKRNLQFRKHPTKKRVSTTKKAGLVLSVARINKRLKAGRYARRIGLTASVYMASVLEYLVAEVLELAGNCARYFRKQRVFPRCIQLTLLHDKELFQLTRGAIVPQGGVKPFIHPVLVNGRNGSAEEQPEVVPTVEPPPTAHTKEDWYGDGGP